MKPQNKFLVDLLSGFSHQQIFFLVWFGIALGFVLLMFAHYRKQTRSHFRRPNEGPRITTKVDARRLVSTASKDITVKKNTTPSQK